MFRAFGVFFFGNHLKKNSGTYFVFMIEIFETALSFDLQHSKPATGSDSDSSCPSARPNSLDRCAGSFNLNYDPDLFSATNVRVDSTSGFDVAFNTELAGQFRASLNAKNIDALQSGLATLLNVRFDGKTNAMGTSPIAFAEVWLNDSYCGTRSWPSAWRPA